MKNFRKSEKIIFLLILCSIFIGLYFYFQMPERIVSHWNYKGQADGYMPKFWGVFLFPLIFVFLGLLFYVIPFIDPLRGNIEKFRKYYDNFFILFFIFVFLIYLQLIFWNIGIKIGPNIFYPVGFGFLFFYTGLLCENTKRNWFIGIRTPWTLSSDIVWDKTHKLGGKLFKIAGIISFFGVVFKDYASFFVLVPVIIFTIYVIIYSYVEYKKVVGNKIM